jgi:two-component system, OmpR family, phosphate regulon response regulator PhoB
VLAATEAAQGLMIRRALEIDGCGVIVCASGREAVLSVIEARPDLMIINAPLRDGSAVALLRWTRSREATVDLPCMVIVPKSEAHVVASLYDAGADLVITRPTELDLLSRRVAATLARRSLALTS